MKIEARNHREVRGGMNWTGFDIDLYVDGVHACHVRDEGHGGCLLYTKRNPDLMKSLEEYAEGHDRVEGLTCTVDTLVAMAVDEVEVEKRLRKDCKKVTLFRLPTDPDGEWRGFKIPFNPSVAQMVRTRYGSDVVIANERFN